MGKSLDVCEEVPEESSSSSDEGNTIKNINLDFLHIELLLQIKQVLWLE
jgi:hypothetical protein